MDRDKLIILVYQLVTNIGYAFILYAVKSFGYPPVFYSYVLTTIYISNLLSALLYGNIAMNEKNYVFYGFLGIFLTLISIFLLIYPENFNFIILSVVFSFFLGSSTSYAFIRVKKDVRLYYYFTIYGLFGYIVAQLLLLTNLDFHYLVILTFISFFIVTVMLFVFYFKKFLDFIISSIKEEYGLLGTMERIVSYMENKGEEISFKFIGKPTVLSYVNFLFLFIFSVFWTSLVTLSSSYNNYYPMFLLLNGLFTAVLYKYLKKTPSIHKSLIGVIIRIIAVALILFSFVSGFNNLYIYAIFYILAGISWAIFSYYMDDFVLNKRHEEYGYVVFFRNLASITGASTVGFIGIYYSLILTFPVFVLSLIITLIAFKKNI